MNPTVFVSYAHASDEHRQRVAELVAALRGARLNVVCDTDVATPQGPPEGWPSWMLNQLEAADWVLVVAEEVYYRRFRGKEEAGVGLGARWEGAVITQQLYGQGTLNAKFIPVLLDGGRREHIPDPLRGATHYRCPADLPKLVAGLRQDAGAARSGHDQDPSHSRVHGSPSNAEADTILLPSRPSQPRTYGEWFHAFGLSIDRIKQWHPIVQICRTTDSATFLVHGHQRQHVELFTLRAWNYLSQECGRHHEFVSVPLRVEWSKPRSSAAWVNHLRLALDAGEASAVDALAERARRSAVFVVLSEYPLAKADLDEEELAALCDFLDSRLPQLMKQASGRNPIRALVTTQYVGSEDSLVEQLDRALKKGAGVHGLKYEWLPPLDDIQWSDIEAFLKNRDPRPPDRVIQQLKTTFEQLSQEGAAFRDLVERLSRMIY